MKKKISLLIGFWTVLALVIITVIVVGIARPRASSGEQQNETGGSSMQTYLDETLPLDGVKTIDLRMSAAKTTIHHAEGGQFRVVQRGRDLPDKQFLEITNGSDAIQVLSKGGSSRFNFFNLFLDPLPKESYVDIYIPAAYAEDLNVSLSAGNLNIDNAYSLNNLEIHVSAGDLSSDGKLAAKNAELSVSAGGLTLDSLRADRYQLTTSAGGLHIGALTGSGKVKSSAGEIVLDTVDIADTLDISASAGSITVGLLGNPSLDFSAKTTAGSVATYFGANSSGVGKSVSQKVGEAPYKKLTVSTSAGSVDIVRAD
jgi:lia operon protein LiaG